MYMSKSLTKIAAIALRRNGESIKDISKKLSIPKSTISFWLRDIILSDAQRKKLFEKMVKAGHRGRMKGALMNKEKRLKRIHYWERTAYQKISSLSPRELFFLGLGLYWGEGVKADRSTTGISNSDSRVIILAMLWFRKCFQIQKDNFKPQIFISDTHRDRENILLAYWSKVLNLPKHQFAKTVFLPKNKKIYENRDIYYGVLALRVLKGSDTKYRIRALIGRTFEVSKKPG